MDQYSFLDCICMMGHQDIAMSYGAKNTSFLCFNKDRKLVYTGRSIDTPRNWKDHNHKILLMP